MDDKPSSVSQEADHPGNDCLIVITMAGISASVILISNKLWGRFCSACLSFLLGMCFYYIYLVFGEHAQFCICEVNQETTQQICRRSQQLS